VAASTEKDLPDAFLGDVSRVYQAVEQSGSLAGLTAASRTAHRTHHAVALR
jgi:hypothetical protein